MIIQFFSVLDDISQSFDDYEYNNCLIFEFSIIRS